MTDAREIQVHMCMIDSAGQCGETDAMDLRRRVEMAVRGYLVGMASGL